MPNIRCTVCKTVMRAPENVQKFTCATCHRTIDMATTSPELAAAQSSPFVSGPPMVTPPSREPPATLPPPIPAERPIPAEQARGAPYATGHDDYEDDAPRERRRPRTTQLSVTNIWGIVALAIGGLAMLGSSTLPPASKLHAAVCGGAVAIVGAILFTSNRPPPR